MAFNNFHRLPTRNQSSLVTQLHKLIHYYGEIFPARERSYLKTLTSLERSIYWLEDEEKKMVATAIVDPNHHISLDGIDLVVLGYLISRRPGQIDRILAHVWSDYEFKSILLLSRPALAAAINKEDLGLVALSPLELEQVWSELANVKTNFFNISNETLSKALDRKNYQIFLRITEEDKQKLLKTNPELVDLIRAKEVELQK
jgi:hypothetical protein